MYKLNVTQVLAELLVDPQSQRVWILYAEFENERFVEYFIISIARYYVHIKIMSDAKLAKKKCLLVHHVRELSVKIDATAIQSA